MDFPELPPLSPDALELTPTDIAQFVRLEQCERFLRLRLHSRRHGAQFLKDYGVGIQAIPPLLSRSGREFEERVCEAVRRAGRVEWHTFAARPVGVVVDPDNEAVLRIAAALAPGRPAVLYQPRLRAALSGCELTGDADLVLLERKAAGVCALVVDVKSSVDARVEHRLQVAFYRAMLQELFAETGAPLAECGMGVLFRDAPLEAASPVPAEPQEVRRAETERAAALRILGVPGVRLELLPEEDARSYDEAVADLVTGPGSAARRVASLPFPAVSFHLTFRCDGCLYQEFCLKAAAAADDLSLVPYLGVGEKNALRRAGLTTVRELATLQEPLGPAAGARRWELAPAPGREELVRRLAATWPVGARLEELAYRARAYRNTLGDGLDTPARLPNSGHSTLPAVTPELHPNLVMVYVDAQHDYLQNRVAMLGALVQPHHEGVPGVPRVVVRMAPEPPVTTEAEAALFRAWVPEVLRAIYDAVPPGTDGSRRAPLHLVFYNRFEHRTLLQALGRQLGTILAATPALYDLVAQAPAFGAASVTFLADELRERRNLPLLCQSLQAVASYFGFDWGEWRRRFFTRHFDAAALWPRGTPQSPEGEEPPPPRWFTLRSRFGSQVPLEYTYAAWNDLPPKCGGPDPFAPYRGRRAEELTGLMARRLEAMAHITARLERNARSTKKEFDLGSLAQLDTCARGLAEALDEFLLLERHAELGAWKQVRQVAPERRALEGMTLLVQYREEDQESGVVEALRAAAAAEEQREERQREAAAAGRQLSQEERTALRAPVSNLPVRLRVARETLAADPRELLAACEMEPGDQLVCMPRWTADSRVDPAQQEVFTPTPPQLLYAPRVELLGLELEPEEGGGGQLYAEVRILGARGAGGVPGFVFGSSKSPVFRHGELYTLDPSPDSWYGSNLTTAVRALADAERTGGAEGAALVNALYARIARPGAVSVEWPPAAAAGQRRFLEALEVLRGAGEMPPLEPAKQRYVGQYGEAPVLLVQGPPGTGKSFTTAYAVLARMQGLLAAAMPAKVLLCCKTHAATDVLLGKVAEELAALRERLQRVPAAAALVDDRVLAAPLFRLGGRDSPPPGTERLGGNGGTASRAAWKVIEEAEAVVVAATPNAIYRLAKDTSRRASLLGRSLFDLLVIDEASQMNLAEAVVAALLLRGAGQLVVVGDHRQMPPVLQHGWEREARRTFHEYRAYESLFELLLRLEPPIVRFEESFRLHRSLAEFLRREIYRHDGIPYHSHIAARLPPPSSGDEFVDAALSPAHPLVVVVHEEAASQKSNELERRLLAPLLRYLAAPPPQGLGLDAREGMGVVVPHRAQRSAILVELPQLTFAEAPGRRVRHAVNTVERYQGDERTVMIAGATESDPAYVLAASRFLLDPRRLNVALSRARRKVVLVASRSIFSLFSPDEEVFRSLQVWKALLRYACPELLWSGIREGVGVRVYGGAPEPEARCTAPE